MNQRILTEVLLMLVLVGLLAVLVLTIWLQLHPSPDTIVHI